MRNVTTLAFEAGFEPFPATHIERGPVEELGTLASKLLTGKNLYFNDEYRNRFGVHVHRLEASPQRLLLGVVESARNADTHERLHRAVIFRCDGYPVYQTPDDRVGEYSAACIDMRYWITHSDELGILIDLCKIRIRQGVGSVRRTESVLAEAQLMQRQGP